MFAPTVLPFYYEMALIFICSTIICMLRNLLPFSLLRLVKLLLSEANNKTDGY